MRFKNVIFTALSSMALAGVASAACPTGTTTAPTKLDNKEVCVLKGTYTFDVNLTSDKYWVLSGGVFIGGDNTNSATISIEKGTTIFGQSGADFLVINRGSKIMAEGAADAPIVFTAAKRENRSPGMWGGLIINGNAPINNCKAETAVCEAEGEGSTGLYGGNDPFDNSGVLKYVRVEWAGFPITPENELNGIAFQGVGAGTVVDYIQVHMNADDGVEFFGGTVNVKHVVLTGNVDDSLDWTSGWVGMAQFVVVDQDDAHGNNGIEADNLKSPMDASPRSAPILSNMTFIGTEGAAAKGGEGILLRVGTGFEIYNTVITGFKKSCLDLDDEETFKYAAAVRDGKVEQVNSIIENTVAYCAGSTEFSVETDDLWSVADFFNAGAGNSVQDPMLDGWLPKAGSPLLIDTDVTPDDLFFDEVDFIGAVKSAKEDWTKGWTTSAAN